MVLDTSFTEVDFLKMDIAELTKQNYMSLTRIKELVEQNEKLMIENEKLKKINTVIRDELGLLELPEQHPLSTADYKLKDTTIWEQGC
tara:strand:- start:270 stop:533 length:264 start_codon:yes stop_codon:yes gene_type:complete